MIGEACRQMARWREARIAPPPLAVNLSGAQLAAHLDQIVIDNLARYRVSRLKIDRRFIDEVTSNADNGAITRATIGLAHALGIEVVAEGVETPAQRDFLLHAGYTLAQGFLFGKPMPAAQASALLRQHTQVAAS